MTASPIGPRAISQQPRPALALRRIASSSRHHQVATRPESPHAAHSRREIVPPASRRPLRQGVEDKARRIAGHHRD